MPNKVPFLNVQALLVVLDLEYFIVVLHVAKIMGYNVSGFLHPNI